MQESLCNIIVPELENGNKIETVRIKQLQVKIKQEFQRGMEGENVASSF